MTPPPISMAFLLMAQYGKTRLNMEELATVLGYQTSTLHNMISSKTCPVPTYKEGKNRWADVRDVGAYLDAMRRQAA